MARQPLVVFDLGGVLLRICRTWEEGCVAAGIPLRARPASPDAEARRHRALVEYQEGRITCSAFFPAYAEAMGGGYSADDVRRVHDAWLLAEYAGVGPLVDALHDAGVETGVLSNTNPSHWARATAVDGRPAEFPTASRTRHPHASHLLGVSKPSEAVYRRFERLTGRAPGEIVFFDDGAANVSAARAAGWRAHAVDPEGDTARQMVERLREEGVL
jgi:HAD superfamily hydrolase (TIGR01509 family)